MRGIPKGSVKIYDQIEEIKAIKGSNSLWPNEPFKHDFKKGSRAAIYGLRDGSILVKSQNGKRLWKSFNYDESDGTRSNPMKRKRIIKALTASQAAKAVIKEMKIMGQPMTYLEMFHRMAEYMRVNKFDFTDEAIKNSKYKNMLVKEAKKAGFSDWSRR